MDTNYRPIYKQAAVAQHKFHDYTHTTAYHPTTKALRNQIHHLTNDLAGNKNPQFVNNRIRTIQAQIRRTQINNPMAAQGQVPILNRNQSNMLHQNFEMMRRGITQHPNFK